MTQRRCQKPRFSKDSARYQTSMTREGVRSQWFCTSPVSLSTSMTQRSDQTPRSSCGLPETSFTLDVEDVKKESESEKEIVRDVCFARRRRKRETRLDDAIERENVSHRSRIGPVSCSSGGLFLIVGTSFLRSRSRPDSRNRHGSHSVLVHV